MRQIPSFHLHARTIRVYEKDYVVFQNVTFYVGKVPDLLVALRLSVAERRLQLLRFACLPELVGPVAAHPGHLSDHRENQRALSAWIIARGAAWRWDSNPTSTYGKDDNSWAKLKTYYLQDQNPLLNRTSVPRGLDLDRALSLSRCKIGPNSPTTSMRIVDVTKLSDQFLMQDFYQSEFRIDPVPDNVVALTKTNPFYTLTAIARFQANEFFEADRAAAGSRARYQAARAFREARFFTKAKPGLPICTDVSRTTPSFENYSTVPIRHFHQFLYPNTYFGWLSVVPRVGFRETYYGEDPRSWQHRLHLERQSARPGFSSARSHAGHAARGRRRKISHGRQRRRRGLVQVFARMGEMRRTASLGSMACVISSSRSRIFPGSPITE